MTFTIKKLHLALAVLAVALIAPATAFATHVFTDVPDGAFYASSVEWAAANDITQGRTPTTFDPDAGVTRGESVTFLKRYDDNIVQPATTNLFASDSDFDAKTTTSTSPVDLGLAASVTIPEGHTGVIEIAFSAESACYGGGVSSWCKVILSSNGTAVGDSDFAFDSSDNATEGGSSWESHAMIRTTGDLPAGTYAITASYVAQFGTPTFRLDDMTLTAEVHLTS